MASGQNIAKKSSSLTVAQIKLERLGLASFRASIIITSKARILQKVSPISSANAFLGYIRLDSDKHSSLSGKKFYITVTINFFTARSRLVRLSFSVTFTLV